jgi:uncharacterized protein (DUF433 family)
MSQLGIELRNGEAWVAFSETPVAVIVSRFTRGDSIYEIASDSGLTPQQALNALRFALIAQGGK